MSELKATTAQEIVQNEKDCDYMDELFGGVKMPPTQVYLKSEADKVIARHKRKRCLAMADYCKEATYYFEERLDKCSTYWRVSVKKVFYERWHKRWLALAEKFKEAK